MSHSQTFPTRILAFPVDANDLESLKLIVSNEILALSLRFLMLFGSGISCPMYSHNAPDFSFHLLKDARCQILVVDSIQVREQVFEWRQKLPKFHAIVQIDVDKFTRAESVYPVRLIQSTFPVFLVTNPRKLNVDACFVTSC